MTVISYGATKPEIVNLAHENFVQPAMDVRTLCTTPIELLSKDGEERVISSATGFFWLHNGQAYLVTNWHVVSGRDPFTGQISSPTGYTPSQFNFYGTSIEVKDGKVAIERKRIRITLGPHAEEVLDKPPLVAGGPVDLWAMQVPNELLFGLDPTRTGFKGAETVTCFINENAFQRILTQAGDECVILGYPLRNYAGGMFPIWKSGSIASEVGFGVDGRPMFLIDAATTPGMSGSPILRRVSTITASNTELGALQEFHALEFIVVYAGRLQSADLAATNLGYGWYQVLIPDVVRQFESNLAAKVNAAPVD